MARNGKSSSSGSNGNASEVSRPSGNRSNIRQWLSPHLNQVDQDWLRDNVDDMCEFIFGTIAEIPAGYTLSSKFDNYTDRWLTTLICERVDDPNAGLALTGRGSTRLNSMYACLYIAEVKLGWAWGSSARESMGDFG